MKLLAVALILSSVISYSDSCCEHIKCGDGTPLEKKLKPSCKGDMAGFQDLVKSFMSAVTGGLPGYVPRLDPIEMECLTLCINDGKVCFTFRDLVIRNLTHVDIQHSVLDTKENFTQIQMNLVLNMQARVGIIVKGERYTRGEGNIDFHLETNTLPCTTKYGFAVTHDEKGVSYFKVLNDDTHKCEYECDHATLKFKPNLHKIFKGNDFKKCGVPFDINDQRWKNVLTIEIVTLVLGKLIENFRVGCRILPANKYVKDIDCPPNIKCTKFCK